MFGDHEFGATNKFDKGDIWAQRGNVRGVQIKPRPFPSLIVRVCNNLGGIVYTFSRGENNKMGHLCSSLDRVGIAIMG